MSDKFQANPQKAVHSFCHALPDRWHLMSVILSAASAVDWAVKSLGLKMYRLYSNRLKQAKRHLMLFFLPYLSGERTPHNDPYAKGVFWGLSHNDNQITMAKP